MSQSLIRSRVIEEIKLIPDEKLEEIYNFIHYFRVGLEKVEENRENIMRFAGCWNNMEEEEFEDFIMEIAQRRKEAFSGRKNR